MLWLYGTFIAFLFLPMSIFGLMFTISHGEEFLTSFENYLYLSFFTLGIIACIIVLTELVLK